MKPAFLIGYGCDDHRIEQMQDNLTNIKPLILGGVIVSNKYTPIAHSDGDAIYHAITNAIFLALGDRDIGVHFPDTDPKYKNINSSEMVMVALKKMRDDNYSIGNISIMITAGKPQINEHIDNIKKNISMLMKISTKYIGIGATSGEGMSAQGRGEGINVVATVLLLSN